MGKLLDFLMKGDSNTMDHLIYSLRATGQSALATTYLRDPLIMPDPFDNTATAGTCNLLAMNQKTGYSTTKYLRHPRCLYPGYAATTLLFSDVQSSELYTERSVQL